MNSQFKDQAERAKIQYKLGQITRKEAQTQIEPFVTEYNDKAKEIAKKWNQKPRLISFASYIR
jgi:hypothetical protein